MTAWALMAMAKHGERVALELDGRALTYAELGDAAHGGAQAIAAMGVPPAAPVALEIADPLEFGVALHACLLGGWPAVPIDLRLGAAERAARADGAAATLNATPAGGRRPFLAPSSRDGLTATVMHTSGTTSAPKRVELSYGNWLANAFASAVALGLDYRERWLCAMPLAHVGGLSILIRSAVYATTVVLHERFSIEAVLGELMDPARRITMVSLVPTMLARLLDAGLARPPSLRWALLGGGPIAPSLLARADAAGVPVAPTYGMTETCSQVITFGLPLHGVELRMDGHEHEIMVRGPMVARGVLDERGWLRTGDLARLADGRIEIVGRKADTIVSGGENVAPAEVEAVLLEHPDVADAGVKGVPDDEWGEAVLAFVVVREGRSLDPAALADHVRARLAPFKVPKRWQFVDALPRTESGKLLRRELG